MLKKWKYTWLKDGAAVHLNSKILFKDFWGPISEQKPNLHGEAPVSPKQPAGLLLPESQEAIIPIYGWRLHDLLKTKKALQSM